jgi:hypothetical protein
MLQQSPAPPAWPARRQSLYPTTSCHPFVLQQALHNPHVRHEAAECARARVCRGKGSRLCKHRYCATLVLPSMGRRKRRPPPRPGPRALKNFSSSAAYSITYGLSFLSQTSACADPPASPQAALYHTFAAQHSLAISVQPEAWTGQNRVLPLPRRTMSVGSIMSSLVESSYCRGPFHFFFVLRGQPRVSSPVHYNRRSSCKLWLWPMRGVLVVPQ